MHIGLAGWSINRRFRQEENSLQLLDYPRLARDEWGLDAVELNSPFFGGRDTTYLDALKRNADEAGVTLWGMAVDGTGSLCTDDEGERASNTAACGEWLEVGKHLGLTYMRFNTGGSVAPDQAEIERCADSFGKLAEQGAQLGVMVCIENHGGLSKTPDPIVAVMERVASPFCRTLPDFGNFAADIRYEALEKVVPYAAACHAKFWEFDEHGSDTQIDIGRIKNIFERAAFDGRLAIEFEGPGDDGEGVRKSVALLRRTFA
jgi:sugar phosphate isomerase/epimerase